MKKLTTPVFPYTLNKEMEQLRQNYLSEIAQKEKEYQKDKRNWRKQATVMALFILAACVSYYLYFDSPLI